MKAINSFWVLATISFSLNLLATHESTTITTLKDIKDYDKKELKIIKNYFRDFTRNPQLFTPYQFSTISAGKLAPIIKDLLTHPLIKFDDTEEVIAFAAQIRESGLMLSDLEKRIFKYQEAGESLFSALRKAIMRERFHRFKVEQNRLVRSHFDPFVDTMQKLNLSEANAAKVINAYAVCISPFNTPYRETIMKPKVCDPIDEYPAPAGHSRKVSVRETLSREMSPEVIAYRAMITRAKNVADRQHLTNFEKLIMAKCMAEQSLRFIQPSKHPLKALRRTCQMDEKSPEEAFFMENGVCGNFSGITLNIAKQIGFNEEIVLAKNGVHIYLEFQHKGAWYHAHPFNSQSHCDIIEFKN